MDGKSNLWSVLTQLTEHQIFFELATFRDNHIAVVVTVPGERWEIEFTKDGDVEIEVFRSDGHIHDASKLQELFERFTD